MPVHLKKGDLGLWIPRILVLLFSSEQSSRRGDGPGSRHLRLTVLGLHGGSALKGWMLWDTALCC